MKFWREASTLILALRPNLARQSRPHDILAATKSASAFEDNQESGGNNISSDAFQEKSCDYKILTLKRNAASSFMPSKLVFPGGAVHAVDYSKEWSSVFEQALGQNLVDVTHQLCSNDLKVPMMTQERDWPIPAEIALRICAIRETFEESGLLVATRQCGTPLSEQSLPLSCTANEMTLAGDIWRQRVNRNPASFLDMCRELGVVPNVWALSDWRNWLTPVFTKLDGPPKKPRRFDTMFYACCMETDVLPNTSADQSETTHADWRSPNNCIKVDDELDQPELPPPQVYEVHHLSTIISLEGVAKECQRKALIGIQRWMPVFRVCIDAVLIILPGDYLYPTNPDFEGMQDVPSIFSCTLSELTDTHKPLHRITFTGAALLDQLNNGTTLETAATVDSVLLNGMVTCSL